MRMKFDRGGYANWATFRNHAESRVTFMPSSTNQEGKGKGQELPAKAETSSNRLTCLLEHDVSTFEVEVDDEQITISSLKNLICKQLGSVNGKDIVLWKASSLVKIMLPI
jgi:hypothetical protein